MNRITIIGNICNKPELRTVNTANGPVSVCTFTVAVNGRKGEDATFFRVTTWRGLADNCARYLDKGRKAAVVGEVSCHSYTNKSGEARASLEVAAQDVEFLTPANQQGYTPVDSGEAAQAFEEPQDLPF